MDLLQFKYFQTVAKIEHISRAAEELNIAQPTLSKIITRLESDLGVNLFDRHGRRIKLNQYGKIFLNVVDQIFIKLENGRRDLEELSKQQSSVISIALNIPSLLPNLMHGFLVDNPKVSLRNEIASITEMRLLLENNKVDFCFSSPPIEGAEIECISLTTEEIFLIVPPDHHLAKRGKIRLKEAANETFVNFKRDYSIRDLTEDLCRQAGFVPNILYGGDITASLVDLVNAGIGVALLPLLHQWSLLPTDLPVLLHVEEPVCQRTIGLSFLKTRHFPTVAEQFKTYVIDFFKKINSKTETNRL